MSAVSVIPVTPDRFDELFALICALADYEHLEPPDHQARMRLYADAFERTPPRYEALLALCDGTACGYCMYIETYSSFLAKPTLYLEDIFVLPDKRGQGIGRTLMQRLARIAQQRGCGRMEWMVLDWNEPAHHFYRTLGAQHLAQWQLYRLTEDRITRIADDATD